MAGAAEFGGPILAAVANSASVFEKRVHGRRTDEEIELRMGTPRVDDVAGSILNPLELGDAVSRLLALFLGNVIRVELLLQLLGEPGCFRLRLPSRRVDGAVAGLAAVDPRDVHVVHVDRQIVQHDLIDLDHRIDEVEHRLAENPVRAEPVHVDEAQLFVQQVHGSGQLFFLILGILDFLQPLVDVRLCGIALARDLLQADLQVGEMLRLPFQFRLLLGGVGSVLHDGSLRDVTLGVEVRLGESIVLIGAIVVPFHRVERLLRG